MVVGEMRALVFVLVSTVALGGCGAGVESTAPTAADERVYSVTDCPSAENVLVGGLDAVDALPERGQTDRGRVEAQFEAVRVRFVGSSDVVAVNVIPRKGEVWYRFDDGSYGVETADDFQIEILLSPEGVCPSSPNSINGIPVVYNRVAD